MWKYLRYHKDLLCVQAIGLKNIRSFIFVFLVCFLMCGSCYGILVGNETEKCPVCEQEITVMEIGSYGSYIYERESKYDLIYFPL